MFVKNEYILHIIMTKETTSVLFHLKKKSVQQQLTTLHKQAVKLLRRVRRVKDYFLTVNFE